MKSLLTNKQCICNKHLSSVQVVVENAFGILSSRFGVFQKAVSLDPEKATILKLACCYLHIFLAQQSGNQNFSSSGETMEDAPCYICQVICTGTANKGQKI